MSQHDTMTQALQQIADWNSHTTAFAVDYGSNGVRDFYRNIARLALSATQPAQAAQSTHWTEHEPVRLAPSRKGRVYLAGPMTGIADFNFPAFSAEAEILRAQGLSVLNPADHGIVAGANWADYLRHDIAGLASCERIHLLPGWSKSKGAQLEATIAKALGMAITYQDGAETQQASQGAGEVVAWQHQKPIEGPTGEIEGYTDWMDGDGSPWWPRRALYTHPTPPPAQPAPVVPDVQREIADALALFPVDLESKTFRVNVYNQSQVIEADGDTQFFSKKKVMALLEKLHGHLTAAATPTPPAQAAADARDAERYRWLRSDGIEVMNDQREIYVVMGRLPFREDQTDKVLVESELDAAIDAALATHQQGGSNA